MGPTGVGKTELAKALAAFLFDQERLLEKQIVLTMTEQAVDFLAQQGFDMIYGARPLKRVIQKHVENPLSMELLEGKIKEGTTVDVDVEGKKLVFIQ